VQAAGAGAEGDGFQRRQRIGNDAAANNNLAGGIYKISGGRKNAQKGERIFLAVLSQSRVVNAKIGPVSNR
jgi:hypothetical protein